MSYAGAKTSERPEEHWQIAETRSGHFDRFACHQFIRPFKKHDVAPTDVHHGTNCAR